MRATKKSSLARLPPEVPLWNETKKDYPLDRPLTVFLEEQVRKTPDLAAVACEGVEVTYGELNRRANRIARRLNELGVTTDSLVGVYMERSIEMVVALLGIIKAGGAYVPFDPEYPQDRLAFMLADSGISVILTQRRFEQQAILQGLQAICLDDETWRTSSDLDGDNPSLRAHPDSAAYMIYTSGSTGKPKGVVNIHRGLVNRLLWMQDAFVLTEQDRVLQKTPYSFDVSVWEFFWPLITGACLAVAKPGGHRDNEYLVNAIVTNRVTTMHFVPSMLSLFLTSDSLHRITSLRQVMSSGEALPLELTKRFFSRLPKVKLHNLYGPTEAAIDVTHWECTPESTKNVVPIGFPIANIQTYILDENLAPVPIGETGELHIGGVGLARGYWNRPDLTRERFVKDPFANSENARLYKTGDLARYLPDGSIEYLGRLDFQIKLRGFRIELGEIEAVLLKCPGILEAVVLASEESLDERQLLGYVVPVRGQRPTIAVLRQFLATELPEYMVPSRFTFLDEMPLLPNGKVNRKALPKNLPERPELSEMYLAPNTDLQKQLCQVWSDLLGIDKVGLRDNFFELGGTSLKAIRMAAELKRALRAEVPVVKVFQYPTIEKLAHYLSGAEGTTNPIDAVYERATRIRIGRFSGNSESDGVAVIGMVGRFPGARNLTELWDNLLNKRESISRFSPDEIDPSVDDETRNDPDYVPTRGIIEDADKFDARFFGIGPLEAKVMDPQQRVFLELAWAALEDAGYDSARFPGMIGVYAGVGDNHYYTTNVLGHPDLIKTVGKIIVGYGNEKDYIATRTSYALNLTGPSVSANTGCSTSLLAVDHAFKALIDFECDMALAGGVDIFVPQRSGHIYREGGTFTKDGHCRPFDVEATGTMFCDGAGIVVLRRLEDAIAAGDCIYAVIRGIAKNNDGANKVSFLAPSVDGQAQVIALAQAQANVLAESISYVEAHGTGTPLGDPIEVEALTRAFRATTQRRRFCHLGSIKGNIGHPTIASGVAGFIKACLALHHGAIPATLHFNRPNPRIDFESSPFVVVTDTTPWPRTEVPRRAGVSSFGFGGTNVHAVLEEAPPTPASGPSRAHTLLLLSAKTSTALARVRANLREFLASGRAGSLSDVAYTLQVGRRHLACRQFVVCSTAEDACAALADASAPAPRTLTAIEPDVVFMFPGQGSQYANMGRSLYLSEPVFRHWIDTCCDILREHLDRDLRELLFPGPGAEAAATESLKNTYYTQPALFVVEYSLARFWMNLGIVPKALVGHSVAEFVCACLAGVFELSDALSLVALRGRLISALPRGAMLSVRCSAGHVASRLPSDVQLAASNAPELCVVAGPTDSISRFASELEREGLVSRPLHTSHAFHSAMMEPIVEQYVDAVRRVPMAKPQIRFMSTCLGDWITEDVVTSAEYWGRHLRMPVLFSDAITKMRQEPGKVFLEVGPRDVLSTLTRQHASAEERGTIIASLGNGADEREELSAVLGAIGGLWCNGVSIDWDIFRGKEKRRRVPLPTYPFERARHWVSAVASTGQQVGSTSTESQFNSDLAESASDDAPEAAASGSSATLSVLDRVKLRISSVVGISPAGIDASKTYLELGFDSLSMTQFETIVQKEFGVKLTWRQLLEDYSTPAKLASHIQDSDSSQAPSVGLTLLKAGGPKRLFLVYDGEGDVLQYLKLARRMPGEFGVYGISPMRLPNIPQAHVTVSDMARHCVGVIRRHQPEGSYYIGGLCAGGVIAFDAARQVEQGGGRVELVILLDAINPQTPFRPWLPTQERWKRFRALFEKAPATDTSPVEGGRAFPPVAPGRGPGGLFSMAMTKVINLVTYEATHSMEELSVAARLMLLRDVMERGREWPKWVPPLRELDIYMKVKAQHHPGIIAADVALVRATMEAEGVDAPAKMFVEDPLYGWANHTTGKLEVIDTSGGHVSMLLDEPYVDELASKLQRLLENRE
jgi:amino acid adenylation domain-containing protein